MAGVPPHPPVEVLREAVSRLEEPVVDPDGDRIESQCDAAAEACALGPDAEENVVDDGSLLCLVAAERVVGPPGARRAAGGSFGTSRQKSATFSTCL